MGMQANKQKICKMSKQNQKNSGNTHGSIYDGNNSSKRIYTFIHKRLKIRRDDNLLLLIFRMGTIAMN